jgi:nuclear migration protein JNM1
VQTTSGPANSDHDFDDVDDEEMGISRSRLRIDQARNKFLSSRVDAHDVDFSDRLNGKRRSYKTSTRRHDEEIGDWSDDEGEGLDRKIARLKREIEEARAELFKQEADSNKAASQGEEITSLSHALEQISVREGASTQRTAPALSSKPSNEAKPKQEQRKQQPPGMLATSADEATYTVTYAPDYEQSHTLAKAADFDRRLVLLEKAIGISSSTTPELGTNNGLPRAIVPTLDMLQRQVLTLSDASNSSLDSITRRVRELTTQANELEKSRKAAKAARDALAASGVAESMDAEDSEQTAKINALYGTLPTIESLSPLLPSLLDRLRSLRAIHGDAASASETLDRIEKSQSEMAHDIKQWREGLDKLETSIKQGDAGMEANKKVIEGWVKNLEAKVAKLS